MVVNSKTYSQKPTEVKRRWILIDATEATLGRVAGTAAKYLIGKYKPAYTAHVDGGDYVVVINAGKLVVTGNKETDKKYYRHSGYVGNMKTFTLGELRAKAPEKVIELAIKGMLPVNKLAAGRMLRLRVFKGDTHTHTAQMPTLVSVIEENKSNNIKKARPPKLQNEVLADKEAHPPKLSEKNDISKNKNTGKKVLEG